MHWKKIPPLMITRKTKAWMMGIWNMRKKQAEGQKKRESLMMNT